MVQKALTLYLPGLFKSGNLLSTYPEYSTQRLSALETFLARANENRLDAVDKYDLLARWFGFDKLPVASLLTQGSPLPTSPWAMCADPVYIMPDRDSAVLVAHEDIPLEFEESQAIADELNRFFADDPWHIKVVEAHRWVLEAEHAYELNLQTLDKALGQHVFDLMPKGKDSDYWKRTLNEMQMFLFSLPLNQEREAQGKLPVNSLWFWGEGRLEADISAINISETGMTGAGDWNNVIGEGKLIEALALHSKSQFIHVSEIVQLDLAVKAPGRHLYMDSVFEKVNSYQEPVELIEKLKQLDEQIFKPVLALLRQGQIDEVNLYTDYPKYFTLNRKTVKRWWRRKKAWLKY